jgi:chromate transport protein ChrA
MTEQESQDLEKEMEQEIEKEIEKEIESYVEERVEEKQEEKKMEEKWRRDPLSGIVWALILIWAGVAFLLWNLKVFDNLDLPRQVEAWTIVLGGVGLILLAEVLIRLLVPAYRGPITGGLILGVIFVGVAFDDFFDSSFFWPLLLIAGGVVFLIRGVTRQK